MEEERDAPRAQVMAQSDATLGRRLLEDIPILIAKRRTAK